MTRAASAVMVQSQRQFRVLGLPPRLLPIVLGGAFLTGIVGNIVPGLKVLVFPVLFGLWLYFWKKCRAEPHYDRLLLVAPKVWRRGLRRPGRIRQITPGERRHVG